MNLYEITKSNESGSFSGINDKMKSEISKFNSSMKSIISYKKEEPKLESTVKNYIKFINEDTDEEDSEVSHIDNPESPKKEFKLSWNKILSPEFMKKWKITDEEAKSVESEVNKISKNNTKIVINGIDPIIEIVKIFNRAYKIFTTKTIPSGRTGGRVSNKTFNEYSWIGDSGDGGSPEKPSVGAWRNDVIFDKWEDAVMDIIKNPKYQVLFNEDTVIKVGKGDPRINVSKKGGEKKQGGGKVLLTFINSMLDGNKLYKAGAQAKFIKEYFDVEVPTDSLGWSGKDGKDTDTNASLAKDTKDSNKKPYYFKEIKDISPKYAGLYCIQTPDKKLYLSILESDNKYVYVKYSESFFSFNKYASKIAKIDKGSMDTFINFERDKKTNDVYKVNYARIVKEKFPLKSGEYMEIKSLNISNFDKETSSPEAVKISIKKVYGVINDENKLLVLPEDIKSQMNKNRDSYKDKLNSKIK